MTEIDPTQDVATGKIEIPEHLGIFPLRDTVIYPYIPAQLSSIQERNSRLIDDAMLGDRLVGMVTVRSPDAVDLSSDDLFGIGTAAIIHKTWKLPDGSLRILVEGLSRIVIKEVVQTEPYIIAAVERVNDRIEPGVEIDALVSNASNQFQTMADLVSYLPEKLKVLAVNLDDPGRLADFIAFHLNLRLTEKQALLEDIDIKLRLERLTVLLSRELQILELGRKIQNQVQTEMGKSQREHYLREQIRALQHELGQSDEREMEIEEFRNRIESAQMPEEAQREALRELERLGGMHPFAADHAVSRTYLDWLVNMPWNLSTEDQIDISSARKILDEDHYGLNAVKDRILEILAIRQLKPDARGPILCFVGPPGVGKTSLGQSIARALGRKFVRISLGGVRDEADIRGHRRTYIGALPGRIMQGIRRVGRNNPVFMLDEIDKLGQDFRGDPAAALLEVLDPQQNHTFVDHYLDITFDLSKVMFITTANLLGSIHDALRDRLEVVDIRGYTEDEKVEIAHRHLFRRQLREHGLTPRNVRIGRPATRTLIRSYTQEAGLRNLEREIGAIYRKVARRVAEGRSMQPIVKPSNLRTFLGPRRYLDVGRESIRDPGVAIGLAATTSGGQVQFIEAIQMRGQDRVILTGQLGDVMRESAQAALTYVRSHSESLGIDAGVFEEIDIHIHFPAGDVPKDGPSAGISIAAAIASLLSGRPARSDVAMTGEITLRGKVLPVGGIQEKVLAAQRAGIPAVILPRRNMGDIEQLPEKVRKQMRFVPVQAVGPALEFVLTPKARGKGGGKAKGTRMGRKRR